MPVAFNHFPSSSFKCCCSGIFEINCSKDIKIQGVIGPCASLEKVLPNEWLKPPLLLKCFASLKFILLALVQKGPLCSDTVVGQGNTSAWKMCGLDKATTLSLIFEIVKKESSDAAVQSASNQFYFQFLT